MPDLKLDLGEGQIINAIAVALAESFSGDKRDALLRDIIRAFLSVKENAYDKETLLTKSVSTKVREMARAALETEIQQCAPRIGQIVRETLGPGFEEEVCRQLRTGLAARKVEGITVSVTMSPVED